MNVMHQFASRRMIKLLVLSASVVSCGITNGETVYWNIKTLGSLVEPSNYDPARIPTAEDRLYVDTSHAGYSPKLDLPSNETVHLYGPIFAFNSYMRTKVTLNTGSELALDGVDKTAYAGLTGSYNTNHDAVEFVLDRATLTVGTKEFALGSANSVGYTNSIAVLSGSTLILTNGTFKMHGGAYDAPYANGSENIVDLRAGSTFCMTNATQLLFGRTTNKGIGQGGTLKVSGGLVKCDSTLAQPIDFSNGGATTARIDLVSGEIKFARGDDSQVRFSNQGTSLALFRQTGGVFTNGVFSFEKLSTGAMPRREIDIAGESVFYQGGMRFNVSSGDASNPRAILRIRGSKARVSTDFYYPHANIQDKPFIFQDYRLTGDAAAGAFPVARHYIRHVQWDGFKGAYAQKVWGVYRVSPEGGAQLLHTDSVDLLCRDHQGEESFITDHQAYGGLLFPDLWTAYVETKNNYQRPNGTVGWTHVFGARLNPSAKMPNGTPLTTPVVRGYVELPTFRHLENISNVVVRLEVVPQGSETLASVVARMKSVGGVDAVVDQSVSPYNVGIKINHADLVENVATDKLLFDFSEVDTFDQALNTEPVKINALVRTATCTYDKPGLLVIFR